MRHINVYAVNISTFLHSRAMTTALNKYENAFRHKVKYNFACSIVHNKHDVGEYCCGTYIYIKVGLPVLFGHKLMSRLQM